MPTFPFCKTVKPVEPGSRQAAREGAGRGGGSGVEIFGDNRADNGKLGVRRGGADADVATRVEKRIEARSSIDSDVGCSTIISNVEYSAAGVLRERYQ